MTVLENVPRAQVMVPYDYFAPWVKVTLVTDQHEFPLWQGTGYIDDGGAAAVKFEGTNLAVLQEVLIEWQGLFYSMTINLSPNYDDAIRIIDSYLIQQAQTQVKVEMGFRTGPKGPFVQQFNGMVESVDFSIGTEITLTLKTVPPPMSTVSTKRSSAEYQDKPFNNQSAYDIISELWVKSASSGPFQYKVEVIPSDSDAAIKKLKTKRDSWSLGNKSMWAGILELIADSHCVAVVDGPVLKIDSKLNSIGTQNPVARFRLFTSSQLGGSTNDYPITSASLKTSGLFARSLMGTYLVATDEKTGEVVKRTAGTPNSDDTGADVGAQTKPAAGKPGGGPSPETSAVPEGGGRAVYVKDPNDQNERDKNVRAALENWRTLGIQLEIESLLIPHLVPHQNIDIVGMGTRVDGRYWIEKLFFQVGPDGGLTRFDCIRTNDLERPGQKEPLAGKVNEAPDAEPEDSDSTEADAEPEGDDNPY